MAVECICVLTHSIFKEIDDHFLSISTSSFSTDYVTASSASIAYFIVPLSVCFRGRE